MNQQVSPVKRIMYSILFLTIVNCISATASETGWAGVDESVIEKYAEQYGRPAKPPLVNTDQGDLLLFVFLLAGTIGGFVAGYSWKSLISKSGNTAKTGASQHPGAGV